MCCFCTQWNVHLILHNKTHMMNNKLTLKELTKLPESRGCEFLGSWFWETSWKSFLSCFLEFRSLTIISTQSVTILPSAVLALSLKQNNADFINKVLMMKFDDFKMRVYWISPIVSWCQYSPVFSIFWGGNIFVYALYLHLGPCQGCASLWGDQAPHTGLGSL